jgi:hypothetical protein
MAWGRRCENGCGSWPDDTAYAKCPKCDEPAKRYSNLTPLDDDEARSIRLHIAFDEFYEKRCARLGIPVEGPIPERKSTSLAVVSRPPQGRSGGGARAQSA